MNEKFKSGTEIIEILKDQGIETDKKLENTINLLASYVFDKGVEHGIKEGKRIGIQQACREFEIKIGLMRSKVNIDE